MEEEEEEDLSLILTNQNPARIDVRTLRKKKVNRKFLIVLSVGKRQTKKEMLLRQQTTVYVRESMTAGVWLIFIQASVLMSDVKRCQCSMLTSQKQGRIKKTAELEKREDNKERREGKRVKKKEKRERKERKRELGRRGGEKNVENVEKSSSAQVCCHKDQTI